EDRARTGQPHGRPAAARPRGVRQPGIPGRVAGSPPRPARRAQSKVRLRRGGRRVRSPVPTGGGWRGRAVPGGGGRAGRGARAADGGLGEELGSVFDHWSLVRRYARPGDESWKHLLAVARAVDPDRRRDKVRAAVAARGPQALEEAVTPEARLPAASRVLVG